MVKKGQIPQKNQFLRNTCACVDPADVGVSVYVGEFIPVFVFLSLISPSPVVVLYPAGSTVDLRGSCVLTLLSSLQFSP